MMDRYLPVTREQVGQVLDLAEQAFKAGSLEHFSGEILPIVAGIAHSPSVLLYVRDLRLTAPHAFQHGFLPDSDVDMARLCFEPFNRLSVQSGFQPICLSAFQAWKMVVNFMYPLRTETGCLGMLGLMARADISARLPDLWRRVLGLIAGAVDRLIELSEKDRRIEHLNTRARVSSAMARSVDLCELLEIVLHACLDGASAEGASILLLDAEKSNFLPYRLEGPSKPIVTGAAVPADSGIAGCVLQTGRARIINDLRGDTRWAKHTTGTHSEVNIRNMIAIPLTAGEEQIGVLEVLNKADGGPFADTEHALLVSLAQEVGFAIRNARIRMFEQVRGEWCKQRRDLPAAEG